MTNQTSKNPRSNGKKKREGLSKQFIQKMAQEMQAIQANKRSSS
ncbi:MAG: hypothetical protein P8Y72_00930 [Anaerolineales bacterium]|jgi:hypothetical protein